MNIHYVLTGKKDLYLEKRVIYGKLTYLHTSFAFSLKFLLRKNFKDVG